VKWETSAVVELSSDTTPTLGGDLDAGTHNINNVGVITATTFSGNVTGNADTATTATYAETAGISTYASTAGVSTVSTNAQGLTGTPNITVGTITGTDATFSGNLTVNGTTTTIDTAVTAVDSLQVDGNVAIGTVTAGRHLTVSGGASEGAIQITNNTSGHTAANGFELIHFTSGETQFLNRENGAMRFDTSGTERLRILADGTVTTGGLSSTPGTVAAGSFVQAAANAGFFTNGYDGKFGTSSNHPVYIQVNGTSKLTIATNGDLTSTGTISDSMGPLRRLGINNHNAATYTLVASDAGKLIREATNSANITIPQNVFAAGDMISIFNVSGGNNTITSGTGTTLYNTADGATGNRTLAAKGVCTIACTSTNEFIISGSGLS
jgi:hypothetical protein